MKLRIFIIMLSIQYLLACALVLTQEQLNEKISSSPFLESPDIREPKSRSAEQIELFYRTGDWHNRPDLKSWNYHCKTKECRSTELKYKILTIVKIYTPFPADEKAVNEQLKNVASKIGGDAVIDIFTTPVQSRIMLPWKLFGLKYEGIIIRYL